MYRKLSHVYVLRNVYIHTQPISLENGPYRNASKGQFCCRSRAGCRC